MKIYHLTREKIDNLAWENCLKASVCPLLYAMPWYLDVVSPQWEALVLQKEKNYLAVMPLPVKKKMGIRYIEQAIFCQQLGIFARPTYHTAELYSQFLDLLEKKFLLVNHYPFHENSLFPALQKYHPKSYFTQLLDLSQTYPNIKKNYRKDRKYNLQAKNVVFSADNCIEPMLEMFAQNVENKIEGGVNPNAYLIFKNLYQKLRKHTATHTLYTHTLTGERACGAFFVIFEKRIYYLFNASFAQHRKANGRTFLINQMIEKYATNDLIFDFESAQKESVANFYASFGAQKTPFFILSWDKTNFLVKAVRFCKRIFTKYFRIPAKISHIIH